MTALHPIGERLSWGHDENQPKPSDERRRIMNKTENDLSFNSAKLDYDALVRSVEVAFRETRECLSRYLGETYNRDKSKRWAFTAQQIVDHANDFAVVAETLDTLYGMRERDEFAWVNKPQPERSHNHE